MMVRGVGLTMWNTLAGRSYTTETVGVGEEPGRTTLLPKGRIGRIAPSPGVQCPPESTLCKDIGWQMSVWETLCSVCRQSRPAS